MNTVTHENAGGMKNSGQPSERASDRPMADRAVLLLEGPAAGDTLTAAGPVAVVGVRLVGLPSASDLLGNVNCLIYSADKDRMAHSSIAFLTPIGEVI